MKITKTQILVLILATLVHTEVPNLKSKESNLAKRNANKQITTQNSNTQSNSSVNTIPLDLNEESDLNLSNKIAGGNDSVMQVTEIPGFKANLIPECLVSRPNGLDSDVAAQNKIKRCSLKHILRSMGIFDFSSLKECEKDFFGYDKILNMLLNSWKKNKIINNDTTKISDLDQFHQKCPKLEKLMDEGYSKYQKNYDLAIKMITDPLIKEVYMPGMGKVFVSSSKKRITKSD